MAKSAVRGPGIAERITRRLMLIAWKYPGQVVAFWSLLAVTSAFLLPRVQYDGSLYALLPEDNPIVVSAGKMEGRMETTPSLAFVFEGEDLATMVQMAEELLMPFTQGDSPWLTEIEIDNHAPYLYQKAFLLLLPEELEHLVRESEQALSVQNPFFVDMELEWESEGDATRARDPESEPGTGLTATSPEFTVAQSVRLPYARDPLEILEYRSLHKFLQSAIGLPPRFRTNPEESVFVAEAFAGPALFENSEEELLSLILARLDSLNAQYGTSVSMFSNLGFWHHSQYMKKVTRSVLTGSQISLFSVILFLGGYLLILVRRLRTKKSLSLWLVPRLFGAIMLILLLTVLIATGIAAATGWPLNIFSVPLLGIMLGVNADYLIHLVSARLDLQRNRSTPLMLIARLSSGMGKGMAYSLWTTGFAMAGLLFSGFAGLLSFGGLFLISLLINYLLTFTLFLVITSRVMSDVDSHQPQTLEVTPSAPRNSVKTDGRTGWRRPAIQFAALLGVLLAVVWSAGGLRYSHSLIDLEPQRQLGLEFASQYAKAVDFLDAVEPSVLMLPDEETARHAYETIRRQRESGEAFTRVHHVESLVNRISKDDGKLEQQIELIGKLRETWSDFRGDLRIAADWPDEERAWLMQALNVNNALETDSLPYRIRRQLYDLSGEPMYLVFVQPDNIMEDVSDVTQFREDSGTLVMDDGTRYSLISSYLLTASVLNLLQQELPFILILAVFGMFAGSWMAFGRLGMALWSSAATIGGLTLTIAVLLPFGFELHLYNIVALPLLIGIGIDCSIHLMHSAEINLQRRLPWSNVARTTLVYVSAASLTTATGFFGFLWIGYPGLADLSVLAITGTLCILIFTTAAVHTWFIWQQFRRGS